MCVPLLPRLSFGKETNIHCLLGLTTPTSIITPFGLFEFLRMPFRLRNAAQSFQRFLDQVLRGLDFCFRYVDDILVASSSPGEILQHLCHILQCLENYGLTINTAKCVFGAPSLDFLGHYVRSQGIRPLEVKVQAIRSFPQPTSQCKLREFTAFVNFYHQFLPSCVSILQPLNELLTHPRDKSTPLTWTEEAISAFNRTKEVLAEATLLAHPKPDAPTCLMTDASSSSVGAVLQQWVENSCTFFSKKINPAETHYRTFDRETSISLYKFKV